MAPSHSEGQDRLSALPDNVLQRVLYHLRSDEAVRTGALSRRWRDVHEAVPVVDLVDTKTGDRNYGRLKLDQWIASAVTSGVEDLDVKLRYKGSNWGPPTQPLCPLREYERSDSKMYAKTQRLIFRCRTLRRLRLTSWTLDLPGSVDMASLDTLCLGRIVDGGGMLQRLLSSCPRLASLTLEECQSIKEITVASPYLRSFAMICCHNATGVELHTTCLNSLHYRGGLPPRGPSFITVPNFLAVAALRIGICEDLSSKGPSEVAPVTTLISRCRRLRYLELSLHPSMAYYSSLLTSVLRGLDNLTELSLQGRLPTDHAVRSVAALLLNAKNLQVLSLFLLGPYDRMAYDLSDAESETDLSDTNSDGEYGTYPDGEIDAVPDGKTDADMDDETYTDQDADPDAETETESGGESEIEPDNEADGEPETEPDGERDMEPKDNAINNGVKDSTGIPPSLWHMDVRCLDRSLRRINIANYRGLPLEKMLAKFLLSKAAVLEEFSVTLAAWLEPREDNKLAKELTSWLCVGRTRVTCIYSKKKKRSNF
ncbi:F-box/LRR-repeat protein At2g42730-like [Triticum dicoccoides]|uniref:F-box/LRR-repeat protein At2g42730-like n=1 Tax=Triticum dicoccoides TaxID=85692 RepID=UPI001890B187|nr:F-box/LRR-repeat protein At2g42730-like [Triticum dicoccoides]